MLKECLICGKHLLVLYVCSLFNAVFDSGHFPLNKVIGVLFHFVRKPTVMV